MPRALDCNARSRSELATWQRIHVDFAGPFNSQMFLLVVDAKSKRIEVIPVPSTTASAIIRAPRFLFATHSLPEVIVSDNGPQFVAQEIKDFQKSNGIRHCLSSPYYPASNGEVERAERTFKESMKKMKDEPGTLADKIARFLLSYRTFSPTATGCTPAELLMGRRIRTRLGILHSDLSIRMSEKTKLGNHNTSRNFIPGDPGMVRDYRDRKRPWIKGVIQDRLGPVTYELTCMVGNLFWKRYVNLLRSLAGSWVADTESKAEIPLDDAYPEVTPLLHSEQRQIESQADSQADSAEVVSPKPQDLLPVSASEET